MLNRRLCDTLLLLATTLLELALRLRPRDAVRGSWWAFAPRPGSSVVAWLAALAATAAAAASGPADAPPAARSGQRPVDIGCPATGRAAWPERLLDAPGERPAAGRARPEDAARAGAARPVIVAAAAGAHSSTDGRVALQPLRASFYRGDPRALDVLPPEATHRSGDIETSTWHFADDAATPVWIACVYVGDEVLPARALPLGTRACTARLRITPMGDPAGLLAVSCR
jgi:hypothetical protein